MQRPRPGLASRNDDVDGTHEDAATTLDAGLRVDARRASLERDAPGDRAGIAAPRAGGTAIFDVQVFVSLAIGGSPAWLIRHLGTYLSVEGSGGLQRLI